MSVSDWRSGARSVLDPIVGGAASIAFLDGFSCKAATKFFPPNQKLQIGSLDSSQVRMQGLALVCESLVSTRRLANVKTSRFRAPHDET